MKLRIADLPADKFPPERPKFKAPLILVHGLWTGSWCWRSWATHFSNLGWECWAVNWRGRLEKIPNEGLAARTFSDCAEELTRVIRTGTSPPVLVAHSMGALMALKAAENQNPAALILVSPLPPRELHIARTRACRLLYLKYFPLLFLRQPFCLEERDFRRSMLDSLPATVQSEIINRAVPESSALIRDFFEFRDDIAPSRVRCPILVLGGGKDVITPVTASRATADWLGADFQAYPDQGHWLIEKDGESITRDIHRWVVQKLGDTILLAEFS